MSANSTIVMTFRFDEMIQSQIFKLAKRSSYVIIHFDFEEEKEAIENMMSEVRVVFDEEFVEELVTSELKKSISKELRSSESF